MTRRITHGGVDWEVEDLITGGPGDWPFWDRWEVGDFEPDTLFTIDRFVTPGSTFIDVGAWIGPMSLWAARLGARVIAVEPDPVAIPCLHRNAELNYATIEIFDGALNDQTGVCHIKPHEHGWGSCMTQLAPEGLEVPCLTMPDLFDIYNVEHCSLVKIDIEGGEAIILEHAAPFLAEQGVPLLVSQHGDWCPRPIDLSWFDGFSEWSYLEDQGAEGWKTVLALP